MKGKPTFLSDFEDVDVAGADLDALTDAQRDVYESVVDGDYGVREYGRETNRSPGTMSNLLRRARDRLEDDDQ